MRGVVKSLAHVGYTVSDLERTVAFHARGLGIENHGPQVTDQEYISRVTGVKDCRLKIGFVQTAGDVLPVEIIEYTHPKGCWNRRNTGEVGAWHICWSTDDVDAAVQRLGDNDVHVISEAQTLSEGPWKGSSSVLLRDPDGVVVELLAPSGQGRGIGRLLGLHHVSLTVADVQEAHRFLCHQLGLEGIAPILPDPTSSSAEDAGSSGVGATYAKCPTSGLVVELIQAQTRLEAPWPDVNDVGCVHLCFRVDSIHEAYEMLTKQGIEFAGPPVEITGGVNKGAYAIYLRGPGGLKCELFQGPPTRVS